MTQAAKSLRMSASVKRFMRTNVNALLDTVKALGYIFHIEAGTRLA